MPNKPKRKARGIVVWVRNRMPYGGDARCSWVVHVYQSRADARAEIHAWFTLWSHEINVRLKPGEIKKVLLLIVLPASRADGVI